MSFSVIYRGSLRAHQLPVLHGICKNASCVRNLLPVFVCNFGPQEASSFPYPVASFLNSIFCMLHL